MFAPNRRPGQYRRVVSGFNAEGKSVIAEDKIIDSKPMHDGRDFLSTVWTTAESPANVLEEGDGALRELPGLGVTSPGGVLLRYHELQADGGPGFHITRSVDFGIILEGQVELEMDDGSSTVLRAGDIYVLKGGSHRWKISEGKSVKWVTILVDGKKFTVPGTNIEIAEPFHNMG